MPWCSVRAYMGQDAQSVILYPQSSWDVTSNAAVSKQRHAPAAAFPEATERPKRSQQCPQQLAVF